MRAVYQSVLCQTTSHTSEIDGTGSLPKCGMGKCLCICRNIYKLCVTCTAILKSGYKITVQNFQWLLSWLLHKRKGRLSATNLSSDNNVLTFRLNAAVIFRVKVKKCKQTFLFIAMHYWGYTLLEVKGRSGLLLPSCLLITGRGMLMILSASSGRAKLKKSSTISMGPGQSSRSLWSRKKTGHFCSSICYSVAERMAAWMSLS